MKNRNKHITINGNSYTIKTREWFLGKKVVVKNRPDYYNSHPKTYAVERDWFHRSGESIEDLVVEAVNNAVCKREDKISEQEKYSDRVESAIDTVKEVHEDDTVK